MTDAAHGAQVMEGQVPAIDRGASAVSTLSSVSLVQQVAELQARLLQSQKMESVGLIAGEIAHDFNNMLTVILGHSEMLLLNDALPPQQRTHLKAIQTAGQRSADLTHQLLTFARKEYTATQETDANKSVRGVLDLLRRFIGKDVQLDWQPGQETGTVLIDPCLLDQMLVNLCINSRDAIPGTGRILISTQNEKILKPQKLYFSELPAGDYVLLTVSDSGCGMSEAALRNLAEPLNATRPAGARSGLGLEAVRGIVQQIGAAMDVHSDPSIGTTIRIYFPRVSRITSKSNSDSEESKDAVLHEQRKAVLLVEDEPALMRLGHLLLTRLGYAVFSAKNSREALQIVQSRGRSIDVVISEIVLPELNGCELARRISEMHPEIRFVFMSDCSADQGKIGVRAHHPVFVLIKPFNLERLASAVHAAVRLQRIDQALATDQD